jgi:hypothetical protein
MTQTSRRPFTAAQLLWVAVIAAVASLLTGWFRWESLPIALAFALASAVISVAIVWFVDRVRRG